MYYSEEHDQNFDLDPNTFYNRVCKLVGRPLDFDCVKGDWLAGLDPEQSAQEFKNEYNITDDND